MKWIDVKEKLPDNTENVLITDGYDATSGYYSERNKYWVSHNDDIVYFRQITHWATMPELPKS